MTILINDTTPTQRIVPLKSSKITLYTGTRVFDLLEEVAFQTGWDRLYDTCPWATVFQSRTFVSTWYQVYRDIYTPLLVTCVEDGRLKGLLTLASSKQGVITGAGASQAEYQVWLATAANGEEFIKKALLEIAKQYGNARIQFQYLPANTPLKWAEEDPKWTNRCVVHTSKQPLLYLDEERLSRELKKKNRREKVNRLNRLGKLEFKCITDYNELAANIDHLITQYDFRQGARFNKNFFQSDPLRKSFLLQLFAKGLLHVSILRLGEEIIASNAGVTGRSWVHLQGFNTYAPFYAKHSPGILHFLMLGRQLAGEGVEVFDFTPGSASYKEDLASEFKPVYELSIGSAAYCFLKRTKLYLVDRIKKGLARLDADPAVLQQIKKKATLLKSKISRFRAESPAAFIKSLAKGRGAARRIKEFIGPLDTSMPFSSHLPVHRDSLPDMLAFEAKGTWLTRWEFLEDAMRRFEVGEHSYTWCEEGRLLACAWLREAASSEGKDPQSLPAGAVVLADFYCHPAGRDRLAAFVASVTAAVVHDRRESPVYALAALNDSALCQALRGMGGQRTTG